MNGQDDDAQNDASMVLAGVVALTTATTMRHAANGGVLAAIPAPPTPTAAAPAAAEAEGRIFFEPGSDALPAEASGVLAKVADAARTQAGKVVLIAGFLDASGAADRHAEAAKSHALAVRHGLEANRVAPAHLVLDEPVVTTVGAGARDARRVGLRRR